MDKDLKPTKQTNGMKKVWILFSIFMGLFMLGFLNIRLDENATQGAWVLIILCVTI